MTKMVYKKCSNDKCGKAIQVIPSGASSVMKCNVCGSYMVKSNKKEFDKIRGYDKIPVWKDEEDI